MSHSGDAVLVALTRGRHIGVDIEQMRPLHDFAAIAKRNFTPLECAMIHCRPPDAQYRAFFTCWSRKEAFIKAVGKGLSIPLNTFDSSIPSGESGRRLVAPEEAPDVESWWIADLNVPEDYAGAIAIEQGFDRLSYYTWSPLL
jgi:4'-phosphopantetheinyl transferase